jgi:WD40 repeat protein/serine/threonine protein kinase
LRREAPRVMPSTPYHREYLTRLPFPLGHLYNRAFNAKAARSRHDNAFYLFEALVKMASSVAIAGYAHGVRSGQPRAAALDRQLQQLASPSPGQWLGFFREISRRDDERPDAAIHPLGHVWNQLTRSRRDMPGLVALYCRIRNGIDGEPATAQSCSILDVLNALVQYRNNVFGHGGPRFESFYEEMGPLLLPALSEVLQEGVLDALGPPGTRLVHVGDIRLIDDDRVEVEVRELVGLQAERLAPLLLTRLQSDALRPNGVAVLWPGRPVPLRLDPLLVHRGAETADDVLFLNREYHQRHVEYLSYTSGVTERDRSIGVELRRLLSVFAGREVSEGELAELARRNIDEAAVEDPAPPVEVVGQRRGDFEFLAEIGRGGMGVVYLVRQLSLGRLVALKTLPADLAGDGVALARFGREIQHLARCDHPNIVKILSSGTLPDGEAYYTMEYVDGCDLELVWRELTGETGSTASTTGLVETTWMNAVHSASTKRRDETVRRRRERAAVGVPPGDPSLSLPPLRSPPANAARAGSDAGGYIRRVCALIRDAAQALQAVHDQGIVHRDVKPLNLMLTSDDSRIVLMDFGLAKGGSLTRTVARHGGFHGTLRYAAPEQLMTGAIEVGPRADIRALGCILWELVAGRRLFAECQDEASLMLKVSQDEVPLLRTIDASLDPDLEAIVARATERRVEDRIATAGQFAEYLQLYLDGTPLPIRTPTSRELFVRWYRRNPAVAALSAAVVVAVILGAVVAAAFAVRASRQAVEARLQANRAEELLYAGQLAAAHKYWDANEVPAAWKYLDAARPEYRGWEHDYLFTLFVRNQRTLDERGLGPHGAVVAYGPDGTSIVTGGADGTVKLWNATTDRVVRTFAGHTGGIEDVAFSPDGTRVLSSSADKTVKVWNVSSGSAVRTLGPFAFDVTQVAFSPDGKWIAGANMGEIDKRTVTIWDAGTGQAIRTLDGWGVAFGQRGLIATKGRGGVRVWNGATGEPVRTLGTPRAPSSLYESAGLVLGGGAIAFSPDGARLIGGQGNVLTVWDVATGRELGTMRRHTGAVESVAFSRDGAQIVSGGADNTVRLWDALSGRELRVLGFHAGSVTSVDFSADGTWVTSGSHDGTVRIWDVTVPPAREPYRGHAGAVTSVAFSPDLRRFASGSDDATLRIWDTATGRVERTLSGHGDRVTGVAFSPDGKTAISGSGDGTVRLWDAASGRALGMRSHGSPVTSVAFSPDGTRVMSAGALVALESLPLAQHGEIKVWDAASGAEVLTLPKPGETTALLESGFLAAAFSPDQSRIVAAADDSTIIVWDARTGDELRRFETGQQKVQCIAISPDGRRIASGGENLDNYSGEVKIWDAETGREIVTLKGRVASIAAVAFSADGTRIASGSADNTVRIWNAATGLELLTLDGHEGAVTSLAFHREGKLLLSGSTDQTIRAWEAWASQLVPRR